MSGSSCETLLTTNDVESSKDQVEMCVLSHRSSMMAWSTLSGLVKLMSLDKKEVKTLGHHSDARVTLLKFSPSDVLLLTVSSEGCIKVWIETIRNVIPCKELYFSADSLFRSGNRGMKLLLLRVLQKVSLIVSLSSLKKKHLWCVERMEASDCGASTLAFQSV